MKTKLLFTVLALLASLPIFAEVVVDTVTARSTYTYEFDADHTLSICRGFLYAETPCTWVPLACVSPDPEEMLPVVTRPVSGVQTGICDSRDTLEDCEVLIVARCARTARASRGPDGVDTLCTSEQTDAECHQTAVASGLCPAPESETIPDFAGCTLFLDWYLKERVLTQGASRGREERQREAVPETARVDDVEEVEQE